MTFVYNSFPQICRSMSVIEPNRQLYSMLIKWSCCKLEKPNDRCYFCLYFISIQNQSNVLINVVAIICKINTFNERSVSGDYMGNCTRWHKVALIRSTIMGKLKPNLPDLSFLRWELSKYDFQGGGYTPRPVITETENSIVTEWSKVSVVHIYHWYKIHCCWSSLSGFQLQEAETH